MQLRARQTRTADFAEVLSLIPDRFLYTQEDVGDLFAMWQEIIEGESGFSSVVIGSSSPILAFGMGVVLKERFREELSADPQPFTAARILRAWKRGDSPIMARDEVAQANAGWGVDLFIMHHAYAPTNDEAEFYNVVMALAAAFVHQQAGLNLRSMTNEFYDRAWFDMTDRQGFTVRHDFLNHPAVAHLPVNQRPFVAGIHRSEVLATGREDFVTNQLFVSYPAPTLDLDPELRQFLRDALEEEHKEDPSPDERWDSIFERLARFDSSLLAGADNDSERRSRVLAWLRSHPEELHPYQLL